MSKYTYRIEHDDDPLPPWEDDDCVIFRLDAGRHMQIASRTEGATSEHRIVPKDWTEHAVYAYIHSGIVLSLKPFACPWDSGHVGFIYTSPDIADPKGLIDELNMYLAGDVWGYVIEQDGEHIESCWGFYGRDNCEEEAQSALNYQLRLAIERKQRKLKQYIRHHVPLEARV